MLAPSQGACHVLLAWQLAETKLFSHLLLELGS